MQYVKLGNTDYMASRLGFGCMRLPTIEKADKTIVDDDAAIAMLRKGHDLGINYFDTAYFYHEKESERVLGLALKDIRDDVIVVTKCPGGHCNVPGDYRRVLEEQLERLGMEYVDYYHFHGIDFDGFKEVDARSNWLSDAKKAKEEGLIRNISFSFHSEDPGDMKRLIDYVEVFQSVLCQYNVLDQTNAEGMAYAKEKGLSVIVMGPLGGGRISGLPKEVSEKLGITAAASAELGLRFVAANPNADVILSGMSNETQLKENVEFVSRLEPLSKEEIDGLGKMMAENKRMADLYCTGCKYCMPCPQEVNISHIFSMYNYYKVYDIHDYARNGYAEIGRSPWVKGTRADACNECGECETKCPQNIEIRKQLKDSHIALA
jgi:predicted aldo/keto reductase-like oxidoreductase